jgi:NAD(P)-dependent dehydrogenase (short-subunit alcohol dehydrogenase family)
VSRRRPIPSRSDPTVNAIAPGAFATPMRGNEDDATGRPFVVDGGLLSMAAIRNE